MELIQDYNDEMNAANPSPPILELITYNLNEIEGFGTPQDFYTELGEMNE